MRVLILSLLCFPKLTMNVYHFCEPRDKRMNICPNSMFKKIFFALSLSERSILEIFPKKKVFLVPLAHSECEASSGCSYSLPPRALSTEPASLPHESGAP